MFCEICGNDTKPATTKGYNQCTAHNDQETEWKPVTQYDATHVSEQINDPLRVQYYALK